MSPQAAARAGRAAEVPRPRDRDRGAGEGVRRDPRRRRRRPGRAPRHRLRRPRPNGAGKTTTIRMLATLLRPDGGEARVLGHDVVREADAVRGRVSLTGQFASVDEDLTGRENLVLLGRLLGFSAAGAAARGPTSCSTRSASTDAAGRQVKNYSGGMRRRLDIAASIVVTPDLLFLDEPTTGLDPRSRNQVWDIVRGAGRRGHDGAADHAVPRRGRPARRPDRGHRPRPGHRRGHQRRAQGVGRRRARCTCGCSTPTQRPRPPSGCCRRRSASTVQLERRPGGAVGPARRDRASGVARGAAPSWPRAGIAVDDFALGQPSLDEVFLALTGHPADRRPTDDDRGRRRPHEHRDHHRDRPRAVAPSARAPLLAATGSGRRRPSALVGVAHLRLAGAAEDQARARAAVRRDRCSRSCSRCCSRTCSAARWPARPSDVPAVPAARHPRA